jgi:predicted permease
VTPLRDQIAAPARPVLLLLLAAAGVVFIIACSNVANLILARSVRREGELAVRAALGASRAALRRTLLAESLVLCGAGAVLGVALARPLLTLVSRFAARFSVRALDVAVDASLLWVGAALAIAAAVLLAFIPRLPTPQAAAGLGLASGSVRLTPGTHRRLRLFAMTQIACSFVLLAGAGMLLSALVAMQTARTGYDMRHVLALDMPSPALSAADEAQLDFYQEVSRRIDALPGVDGVAYGSFVPWRDAGTFGAGVRFLVDGFTPEDGDENPRARFRIVSPGYFSVVGVPLLAGREFTSGDRHGSERVVIVSQAVARLFHNGDALNRQLWWTDPYFGSVKLPRRIVGIVADVDDERVAGGAEPMAVYHPVRQMGVAGRFFVQTAGDPYALVAPIRRVVRDVAPLQPIERPATLHDVRADVLEPERVNAFVVSGFAAVALLIAVVGVAGVLAFSVSARTREFGVRLAIGSSPRQLLLGVIAEGALIVAAGIAAGAAGGYGCSRVAANYLGAVPMPGPLALATAAAALGGAAIVASLMPAARAARVNVLHALRSE